MLRRDYGLRPWIEDRSQMAALVALCLLATLPAIPVAKCQEPAAQPPSGAAGQDTRTGASATTTDQKTQKTPGTATATAAPNDPDASASDEAVETIFPRFENTRFWLSGQGNFIYQDHPPIHALYSGPNSLKPGFEQAVSRVMTLYAGVRLNNSTELLADIEESSGGGLSNALGLAGITNLDVVRTPGQGAPLSTAPYLARGMIHKVFALSKDKDKVAGDRNAFSLFDQLPRRRLEIRFGKFGLVDFFDVNSVGSDSHFQFCNWTVDQNGAFDFAGDTRGYTVGLITDYEDRNWGFRFAEALMPKVANGIDLVWKFWQAHSENFEFELRHGMIPKKPGVVRLLAYVNHANMGIYSQAIAQFESEKGTPGGPVAPDITNHPWRITRKYGFGVNLEQNLTRHLTAFGRFGWNNDKTESFVFTEVGQTFSGGIGAEGALWHRRHDRAGLAFATNAISKDHQQYLALGGMGFLLGDGKLNYGRENIVESYYTAHVWRGIYVAPGVHYVVDPGYNRDRGPAVVPSFRLHVEF